MDEGPIQKDSAGERSLKFIFLTVGVCIVLFGLVIISQKQYIPGGLIVAIGVFDLIALPFLLKLLKNNSPNG